MEEPRPRQLCRAPSARRVRRPLRASALLVWAALGACGEPSTGELPVARCYPQDGACGEAMFAGGLRAELGDPVAGAKVFADNCARCHGADGAGLAEARHIDMRSAAWQASLRDAGVVATVRAGRAPKMPAFDLGDTALRDLLAHVRSLGAGGAR